MKISIIIPARNEAASLMNLLPMISNDYPDAEIIIVDDGSDDGTKEIIKAHEVKLVSNPYSMGNGASIKAGVREACGDIFVFMDADGQHSPKDIGKLLEVMDQGFDMVVGARDLKSHANAARAIANLFYTWFASWVSGHEVKDLTSGFRAVRADKFREFLHLLPNGFSYPTTITMAMFRSGYKISYVPISVNRRIGKSHIKPFVDGVRFILIIFRIGTLYSPLKIFVPISFLFFINGIGYYVYTYLSSGRFTNMSTLLLITSVFVLLI